MDIINQAALRFADSPLLVTREKTLSFRECSVKASQIANTLFKKGYRPGDIAALLLPGSPEYVLILLGLLKAGLISAPLNNRFPEKQLSLALEQLQPPLLLTEADSGMQKNRMTTLSIHDLLKEAESASPEPEFPVNESRERPVTIIHTSASSGKPKAAVHSFSNHWFSALGSASNLPLEKGDCWLLSLPLFHIGGYAVLFKALLSGSSVALPDPSDSLEECLRMFSLTHLSLVPTQLYRLLRQPSIIPALASLKALLLGGSPIPPALLADTIRKGIPVYLSYGSTEMSSQIATTPNPADSMQENSGRILPFREVMTDAEGEILCKGECLFQGYLQNGRIEPQTDGDGWFHTNDIGRIDEKGMITVLGRKDNMFISGGENIHPEEIEKALLDMEGILQAVVVPVIDKEYGSRPAAFIQTEESEKPDDEAIAGYIRKKLGKLKTPVKITRTLQWETLAGSQKIDRKQYRQLAGEALVPTIEPSPPDV
ncbi:o-succinylbenzoate--CoA ligase [Chlorobium phaeobacteroides]|uniref:O-succinylbenzoate-CoA ligase n=1 Tax=Chlorobium phaeobacteroides (strain DSM 266 / SMG 266 / 2430) TaxID=290317 RepID=A1BI78_CHLPD|nr:o-succinylbenzoate--CoA ligase [Chlorobium phaeobacteroides]ABL66105.1 O-succinylbenzoate-CoA ligase [Chlorobium phaeobacteroides DSM 266]